MNLRLKQLLKQCYIFNLKFMLFQTVVRCSFSSLVVKVRLWCEKTWKPALIDGISEPVRQLKCCMEGYTVFLKESYTPHISPNFSLCICLKQILKINHVESYDSLNRNLNTYPNQSKWGSLAEWIHILHKGVKQQ